MDNFQNIFDKLNNYRTINKIDEKKEIEKEEEKFNLYNKDKKYIEWRYLDIENRLKLINIYFDKIVINDELKNEIIQMVKNGKLKTLKEIKFDKINQQILEIKFLYYDEDKKEYLKKKINKKLIKRKKNLKKIKSMFK